MNQFRRSQHARAAAIGAGLFGVVIGWNLYFLNRYRKDVAIADITTIIGAIGGAAVLALFPTSGSLFPAYGFGLTVGFLGYFAVLSILVRNSENFDADWFIDGRYKDEKGIVVIPDQEKRHRGMGDPAAPISR